DRGAHRRVLGDDRHGEGGGLAVAQFELHELGGIELHETVGGGVEIHPQKIDLLLAERGLDLPPAKTENDQHGDKQRSLEARRKHEAEVAQQLATAGEVDEIMLHARLPYRKPE